MWKEKNKVFQKETDKSNEVVTTEEYYTFPASFAQKRLYFLNELLSDSSVYNMPMFVSLKGNLNKDALERALNTLVNLHEALRTHFSMIQNEVMQIIRPYSQFKLEIKLVRSELEANAYMEVEARKQFDLNKGPLFEATLLTDEKETHFLLINMHHIISDGWSVSILFNEIFRLYQSFAVDEELPLSEPEFQYADYSGWQEEQLEKSHWQKQLAYWKEKLGNDLPVLQLPTEKSRSKIVSNRGSFTQFTIPLDVSKGISQLCQTENSTLFIGVLTAFNILLSRYSQQEDIIIGTTIANRNRIEFEETLGLFANTIAIRTDLSNNPTFRELLKRVRNVTIEAYDNQDIPFEKIVEELNPTRSLNHSPIFQAMFVLQNTPDIQWNLTELEIQPIKIDTGTAKFELTLDMENTVDGLVGVLEYQTDLFNQEIIDRMSAHFQTLLANIVQNPDQPINELQFIIESERRELLYRSIEKQDTSLCSHEIFAKQAEKTPDAIAIIFEDQTITYEELNQQANQLAHYLRKKGVGPEIMVGLCIDRSIDLIIGILGILKAGGAYVPIDPTIPKARLDYFIQDSGINLLLTQDDLSNEYCTQNIDKILLDKDWLKISKESKENLNSDVHPGNLAYVIYTSGSTGDPKGTLIPHENITRLFASTSKWFQFNENDTWTLFHSYAFDFSVWEIWGALLYGGKLVIVPYWVSRDTEKFYDLLIKEKVTILNQTPSAFYQLIKVDEKRLLSPTQLSLRKVVFGGEALEYRLLRPWIQKYGDKVPQLVNMYGITETTVHVTYRPITCEDIEKNIKSMIGITIPDLYVLVLDAYMQPVPVGVQGELFVGGAGLARGYLNKPELTATRFIDNPFSQEPEKLYRTGDLGKILLNGEIEYCGRIDNQVKIRGFRIELGEIESKLVSHPKLREAVVVVNEDSDVNKKLLAYVTSSNDIKSKELRDFLRETLPDYMVPSQFMILEQFPLTSNGKIDRGQLLNNISEVTVNKEDYIGPRNEVEEIITEIWSNVLEQKLIGIDDNYFELGGDSIKSIQILSLIKEKGYTVDMADIFMHQTIRKLAPNIRKKSNFSTQLIESLPVISKKDMQKISNNVEDIYPLTKLQEGMLYHSELSSITPIYHNISTFRIRAPYEEEAWTFAFEELLSRHPILRTSFDFINFSEPMQIVHHKVELPIKFVDLTHLNKKDQDVELNKEFEYETITSFDWMKAPLLRVRIYKLSDDVIQMSIIEHHAILDGWSVASMQTELFSLYQSKIKKERTDKNSKPKVLFKHYLELERKALHDQKQKEFWINKLTNMTFSKMPRWNNVEMESKMELVEFNIPKELSNAIKSLAMNIKVHVKSILLAAHFKVISILSGNQDIVTGVVSNGRSEEKDGEKVLGLFLNTLPIRINVSGGTWIDLIKTTFKEEQETLDFRRYPVSQIQQDCGGDMLFETFFNFTNFHVYKSVSDLKDIEILQEDGIANTSFPFGVEFGQDLSTSDIRMDLRWDMAEFSKEQIELIGDYYLKVLNSMVDNPKGNHESKHFLSEKEMKLMKEWNDTQVLYEEDHILHRLIEFQVEKSPEQIALKFEKETLTYREMNNRINNFANELIESGVKPGDFIGICLDRSIEMVISLIGILKVGAAYVPMDPENPVNRIADLIKDSGISMLITNQRLKEKISSSTQRIKCIEEKGEMAAYRFIKNPNVEVSEKDMAYMLYTSGSTGKPKGVIVSHRAICNRLLWKQDYFKLSNNDRVLQKTPYTFDVSIWEFFWPLITGACLVIAKPNGHKDPNYLVNIIQEENISTVHFVPSMLQEFIEEDIGNCTSLKRVLCSGEALPFDLQQRFFAKSESDLFNLYGPTEAAIDVSCWKCIRDDKNKIVSIGKPISNIQLYILNNELQPVPIGVTGELFIGGVGLAEGYHQQPAITEERFIASPFSTNSKERLYRTGDLAAYSLNGNIEYKGRTDYQIKIRGFRVELGEIEAVISSHPIIRDCVVLYTEMVTGMGHLAAYLVTNQNDNIEIKELQEYIRQFLPYYMVPTSWTILDNMPLTSSGKADRKQLPAPDFMLNIQGEYVPARDILEWKLVRIWEEILHVKPIGVRNTFVELGGHSLLAVRLMTLIKKKLFKQVTLPLLMKNDTVEKMASVLRKEYECDTESSIVKIQSGKSTSTLPLFLIHPVGGNIFCYKSLIESLGDNFTIYGIQSPSISGGLNNLNTLDKITDFYIKEIKKVQQQGPYCIVGWSFGGVVGFEIARKLKSNGDKIKTLTLLDSYLLKIPKEQFEDEKFYLLSFLDDLLNSLGDVESKEIEEQIKQFIIREDYLEHLFIDLEEKGFLQGLEFSQFVTYFNAYKINLQALSSYQPKVYDGNIMYFRAEDSKSDTRLNINEWKRLVNGNFEIQDIRSNHYQLLHSPHSEVIAQTIKLFMY